MLAWREGALTPIDATRLARGWLYGDGCFTTLRMDNGKPLWLSQHHARLTQTAAFLTMPCPLSLPALADACRQMPDNGAVRITLIRGGADALHPSPAAPVEVLFTLRPVLPVMPMRLATLTQPVPLWCQDARWFKHLGYTPSLRALQFAAAQGYDDALWLSPDGQAMTLSTGCVLWCIDGQWHSTPYAAPSIALKALSLELPITERPATLATLQKAEALVQLNSVRGCIPVAELAGSVYDSRHAALAGIASAWHSAVHNS